ncbi:anaerobic ribonucleoside-triphosphate reductase activating protein [Cellulosilyticum ruminicola]|uniref:anaerobic ribonucleoside-triphosphate reductase activating protein n=1 Tax=Cellulosilyticum ruminicola TaxID=425254 RepID=UPI0006D2A154|nr:anaerobic ribonucleoside-triphosphate reductase activating protein [Cellulosilyticum ruminicola]
MYYAQMRKYDIANGPGIRSVLFVSGCTHNCPGCFNKDYQDFKAGNPWSEEAEATFMSYVHDPNVHGVTILGGEPMQQTRDNDLLHLLQRIKLETNHTIWLFSGYVFEEIIKDEARLTLLKQCDVLVDGPFIETEKDIQLKFRGSRNQRIIDVPASLKSKQIVLLEL